MPSVCRPVAEGGLGFDFRLAMAIPDKWIKLLKESSDEQWNMGDLVHTLTNRRWMEKTIAYAESHDQVWTSTQLFFRVNIYLWRCWRLLSEIKPLHFGWWTKRCTRTCPSCPKIVQSSIEGWRCIKWSGWLLTPLVASRISISWVRMPLYKKLNFANAHSLGNEFGHPEWLDFPRKGNNDSYHYARRQWPLVDNDLLKYKFLNSFDEDMNNTEEHFGWLHKDNVCWLVWDFYF